MPSGRYTESSKLTMAGPTGGCCDGKRMGSVRGVLLALGVAAVATANSVVAVHIVAASAHEAHGFQPALVSQAELTFLPPAASVAAVTPAPAQQVVTTSVGIAVPPVDNGQAVAVVDPSTVATATVAVLPLFSSPGAPAPDGSLRNPNYLGAPVVLLVVATQPGWVDAYVPIRPKEATAWVPAADVVMSTVPCHIEVSLGAHRLVRYCNNTPTFSAPIASGAAGAPTPTGSYFVAYVVRVSDPGGPYGPWALGTSDFSDTYDSFEGGPGQIGIHGTDEPWVVGSFASHGCIRLYNQDIAVLAPQVLPGTPVEIGP